MNRAVNETRITELDDYNLCLAINKFMWSLKYCTLTAWMSSSISILLMWIIPAGLLEVYICIETIHFLEKFPMETNPYWDL